MTDNVSKKMLQEVAAGYYQLARALEVMARSRRRQIQTDGRRRGGGS